EPTVALRLTELGYRRSFGFSYWERADNELTGKLFAGITEGVQRVKSFDEVLEQLPKLPLEGSFVQIVRQGLDQVGHRYRDRPNIAATVQQISDELRQLQRCLAEKDLTATIFLTADHGILWSHEHELKLYEAGGSHVPPRYCEGLRGGEGIWLVQFEGNDFAVLTYPFVRRKLRSDEWGVHGGLSFEESFVPFVTVQADDKTATAPK
ncbi:MAG: alkaline phosphatase family protein, partial [Armatimonadota bacterium]